MEATARTLYKLSQDFDTLENARRRDEYYAKLKKLAKQESIITEQTSIIKEQASTIDEQTSTIDKQASTIDEQASTIDEQASTIANLKVQIEVLQSNQSI